MSCPRCGSGMWVLGLGRYSVGVQCSMAGEEHVVELAAAPLPAKYSFGAACSFGGCGRLARYCGLCAGHNSQRRRGSKLRPLRIRKIACSKCAEPAVARGLCLRHYRQQHRRRRDYAAEYRERKARKRRRRRTGKS